VNKHVGVRELKYGVIDDPTFTGYVTQPNFGTKMAKNSLNYADAHL